MARKLITRPSFFKVLVSSDFTRRLRLPPSFVEKHGFFLPENVKLRTSSGRTWDVKYEQTNDDEHCFTRGWNEFVKDLKLKQGEFVVFSVNCAKTTFDVSVFMHNGCKKEFSGTNSVSSGYDNDADVKFSQDLLIIDHDVSIKAKPFVDEEEDGNDDVSKSMLYFEIFLTDHYRSRVGLGKPFATAAGLSNKKNVWLEYLPRLPLDCPHKIELDSI